MKGLWTRGSTVVPIGLICVAILVQAAVAAPFPKIARSYTVWMTRAMDECNPTSLTVLSPPGLPANGCPQTNTVTDDSITMDSAKLFVGQRGKITLLGFGFPGGAGVKVQLVLRVTRIGVDTNVGTGLTVTFPDQTVQCPTFTAQVDGSIYGVSSLSACLGSNSGLDSGNVEVVDASLLNADNGDKLFAKPGTLQQPGGGFFPKSTKNYTAWLARAMDECNPPSITVLSPNMPTGGCLQANSVTDDTLGLAHAALKVTKHGQLRLRGVGFKIGDVLRALLKLRITRSGVNTNIGSGQSVTFQDVTVACPRSPDAFAARLNGSVVGVIDLGACLAPTSGLAQGNIEVLDASLVNVVNGKTLALPGILR